MDKKIITYSLLSHIRSRQSVIEGPIDIFIPLVKRSLSLLNTSGQFAGRNISEVQEISIREYNIEFPIPVLVNILNQIADEINTEEQTFFHLYQDGSFEIRDYSFAEYENTIKNLGNELAELESFFTKYKKQYGRDDIEFKNVTEFLESNKSNLSEYLADSGIQETKDESFAANFIAFIRNLPPLFELVKRIYLGSILSSYLEYKPKNVDIELELVLDTNFILGLLDLNTIESTQTCRKVIEISHSQGFKLTVLQETIKECQGLLRGKAKHIDKSFLIGKVNEEDVYNACERRNLNKADLERTADNLEKELSNFGISFVYETKKYRNLAKYSKEYEYLKSIRSSEFSALHDATAIHYVRNKRGRNIEKFEDVNCWFLNNSSSRERYRPKTNGEQKRLVQKESIKADDLLNILWLSNPTVELEITGDELANVGINSLLSLAINRSLPSSRMIGELEDNIHKYAMEDITDNDVLLISKRISQNQLNDIESLNSLAASDKAQFVRRLESEARKQEQIQNDIYSVLGTSFEKVLNKAQNIVDSFENQEKENIEEKNKLLEDKLKLESENERLKRIINSKEEERRSKIGSRYISRKVIKWRLIPFLILGIELIIIWGFVKFYAFKNQTKFWETCESIFSGNQAFIATSFVYIVSIIFVGIFIRLIYDRYFDPIKTNNYKKSIVVPESKFKSD